MQQVTDFAPLERSALADLLVQVGPDAPTLCEGWTTRDLAAHLVVRGSRIDAAAGIMIPALAEHTKRVQDKVAAQDWTALVAKVRQRPWWAAIGDEATNRVEYFVHHQEVRRAQPGWQPRALSAEFAAALWARMGTVARLALRRTPASVTITAPGHGSITAGRGGPGVDVLGTPAELILFLSGRQRHTDVELAGPSEITERMRTARYGV